MPLQVAGSHGGVAGEDLVATRALAHRVPLLGAILENRYTILEMALQPHPGASPPPLRAGGGA